MDTNTNQSGQHFDLNELNWQADNHFFGDEAILNTTEYGPVFVELVADPNGSILHVYRGSDLIGDSEARTENTGLYALDTLFGRDHWTTYLDDHLAGAINDDVFNLY